MARKKTKSSSKTSKTSKTSKKGGKSIKPEPIDDDQLTRLLVDVEKLNVPRHKIALSDVMGNDPKFYCVRKTLARGFQKKWDLVQKGKVHERI